MGRYEFVCVAPEISGPDSTDDLDEALLFTSDYYGSHWEIWDAVDNKYIDPVITEEEIEKVKERLREKHGTD